MVSPELLRRYPFFAGLTHDQLVALAMTADEMDARADHRFFSEGDRLDNFYLVVEGDVGVIFELPARGVKQSVAGQLTGELETEDVVVSHVGPGEPFGWSAMIGEGNRLAGATAQVNSKVIVFNMDQMRHKFDEDPVLRSVMLHQALRSLRRLLHDLRLETMSGV